MPTRTTSKLTGPTSRYALIQGSYWACYCSIITFSSVYLLFRGFSNAQIGVLISLSGTLSALLQPFVSRLADGLRRISLRQFTALLVLFQLAAGLLLLLLPGRLPQTILYALLLILIQLVMPLCSALGMACINSGLSLNFGAARSGGSIAYGLFSALCGQLVLWFGALSIPVAMTVLNLVFLAAVITFKFKSMEQKPRELHRVRPAKQAGGRPFFLQYRRMGWLLFGVVCMLISHNVLNTYAFQIIRPLGGDSGQMGTMLMIQSLVELPVMFLFAWMVGKAASRFWLRISGIGFFLHALGTLLAPNMLVMYVIQLFEMNGYALLTLASVYFINEMVADDQRVQGQAWFAMAMTLGSVLASLVGGLLLDYTGVFVLLVFATAAGAAGMAIFWVLLAKGTSAMTPVFLPNSRKL